MFGFNNKMIGVILTGLMAVISVVQLSGCAGGAAEAAKYAEQPPAPIVPPPVVPPPPTLTIALTDSAGVPVTSLSSGSPVIAKATVKNSAGALVPNIVVTFSTDPSMAVITPASATALTGDGLNGTTMGVASVILNSASLVSSGAATIEATGQVDAAAVVGSIGYSVGAASVSMTSPLFGVAPLSAYGTTSVAVSVFSNGQLVSTPQSVSFTSPCSVSEKAVLTATALTVNGVATASYRDNGCIGTDTITASVGGMASSSSTLSITPPVAGYIQFISASPQSISLKGTGGAGNSESSKVTFKVIDNNGNPAAGKSVSFSLSTSVGGVVLSATSAVSDSSGQVFVNVASGTVSTPVRVQASTPTSTALLTTQSDMLTITTGIPDQQNFSTSLSMHNIEGWNYDGTPTQASVWLADHFNNPVPDGTIVNFVAEGGLVGATCSSAGSRCSVAFTSQALRPDNGRVTLLAYALGEEGFTDRNGNGLADNPTEMVDANSVSTDMSEPYIDWNENGVHDATEPFIDFNQNSTYNTSDGNYNGVLCDNNVAVGSSPVACAAQKSIHTRASDVVILSSSTALMTVNDDQAIALPPCDTVFGSGGSLSFSATVVDIHGNAMPAGTTVAFVADNGTVLSGNYVVPDTTGCRESFPGCPANSASATFGDSIFVMRSDAVFTPEVPASGTTPAVPASCKNISASGFLSVVVTTPKGVVTKKIIAVTD